LAHPERYFLEKTKGLIFMKKIIIALIAQSEAAATGNLDQVSINTPFG
jgi:hypothetical protein